MQKKNILSRRNNRLKNIAVIYKRELLEIDYDIVELTKEFNLNQEQIEHLLIVIKWDKFNKTILSKLLNENWSLDRLSPLIKAIILNACVEFWNIEPKIVINEAIEITKDYFGKPNELISGKSNDENLYQFVNGVLENFYKLLIKFESESKNVK
ncbi:N utilization substance protein B [Mycoplasmopsis mustelae]|uniref:N utilization substance protein B n=1 Tax=Mycoplasmopsis mustelae TaxID=171289 RepID=A0A4R7UE09_9BACT|nr:transcription antitermination factor NusB [Mycoplasmopsis mustelae]TDV23038.1 N utilization substance protein B [Mycoplasmopsis mustelae]